MTLLSEVKQIASSLDIPVETGVFSGKPPERYIVLTPLSDRLQLYADNAPESEVQEVRISLYTKASYISAKNALIRILLAADITITDSKYIGHEDDTDYYHYAVDTAKNYEYGKE